ncbi:hypothetical protein [Saccharopolyspora gregorii]|uniref:hypothetical protein n=1 Tax=Saccharopolyspora gregorii TaxID=33914 RepID=UPI0021AC8377|nr:hypothetical protein [Saccharopolyspora gregorii]
MPLMDDNDPELTQTQFMEALRDLIQDATVADLPDGNRLDVEFYDTPGQPSQVPGLLCVVARFNNAAGELRRQHLLLGVRELSETDWNYDHGEPVD